MEVARSAGRHVWVENLRRADVEVLDIVLGPRHRAEPRRR
jgi:hypothetical protein